jgi:hypothetical protein
MEINMHKGSPIKLVIINYNVKMEKAGDSEDAKGIMVENGRSG